MASRSLNRVILIGNLTRDPELKYTPAGTAVCTFGLATNRNWTTATGETKEDVQFHRIVAWQKLAELCGKMLVKGKKVYLEGRITYRNFTGKDGQPRSITEIVLDDFVLFDSAAARKAEGEESHGDTMKDSQPMDEAIPEESTVAEKIDEDDIPF
ncbi:MAG TPA: single-stranded DNA-binding protein [Candidatus Nitrosocosmicus sp.]|nr:single-stranded DNA-binding protein [Candidatus Nitrosocosmicus sp.]